MIDSSPAARLLLTEAAAIEPILRRVPAEAFDRPTVCTAWSVRDVLAHCSAALHRMAGGDLHRFTPADNQADVEARRDWPIEQLVDELLTGYPIGAKAVDQADGRLDLLALAIWVHGGDVREPFGARDAYTSAGLELAIELFVEHGSGLPAARAELPDRMLHFGAASDTPARVITDVETLVRLLAGRRPSPLRYHLDDIDATDLTLFH